MCDIVVCYKALSTAACILVRFRIDYYQVQDSSFISEHSAESVFERSTASGSHACGLSLPTCGQHQRLHATSVTANGSMVAVLMW